MQSSGNRTARDQLIFLLLFFNGDGLEIFGFKDLTAVQAFNIIHAVASRDDHGAAVLTSGLHKSNMGFILMMAAPLSRGILPVNIRQAPNPCCKAWQVRILADAVP